jgi:hypothetical protein
MATNKTYNTTVPLHDFPGGAANSTGMIESSTASCVGGWRSYTGNSATSGSSYGGRFQHYIVGAAGSGAALRVYSLVKAVAAGSLYGLECTAEIMSTTSSSVSNEIYAGKFVLDLNLDCSTTQVAVLDLELSVPTGKTLSTTTAAFIKFDQTDVGTQTAGNVFYFADTIGTESDTALVTTRKADCTATHAVKINAAGTTLWLMASTDTPAS